MARVGLASATWVALGTEVEAIVAGAEAAGTRLGVDAGEDDAGTTLGGAAVGATDGGRLGADVGFGVGAEVGCTDVVGVGTALVPTAPTTVTVPRIDGWIAQW